MQRSIYLAKLIGPVLVVMSLSMLLNGAIFRGIIDEFLHSHARILVFGLIGMTVGIAIVLAHNVWTPDWRVIITLLGWLSALGGAFRTVAPQVVEHVGTRVFSHAEVPMVAGFTLLVLGAVLSYFGYVDEATAPRRSSRTRKRSRR